MISSQDMQDCASDLQYDDQRMSIYQKRDEKKHIKIHIKTEKWQEKILKANKKWKNPVREKFNCKYIKIERNFCFPPKCCTFKQ